MVKKTASNADLITRLRPESRRKVNWNGSKKAICSICGTDNVKTYRPHWPLVEYDKEDRKGKKTCYFTLDGAKKRMSYPCSCSLHSRERNLQELRRRRTKNRRRKRQTRRKIPPTKLKKKCLRSTWRMWVLFLLQKIVNLKGKTEI